MFEEGGAGADVRPISIHDNRGAGVYIRHQLDDVPDGTKIVLEVEP